MALLKPTYIFGIIIALFTHLQVHARETSPPQKSDCPLKYTYEKFSSNGKLIGIEIYSSTSGESAPPVVFIHGTAGLLSRQDSSMPQNDNFGEKTLACSNYVVVLIHYMDSSGMLSVTSRRDIEKNADLWLQTLEDGISFVLSRAKNRETRIGLIGESLGGYLAVILGAKDKRIAAVSEISGGVA